MKNSISLFIISLFTVVNMSFSQSDAGTWRIGIGAGLLMDGGKGTQGLFDFKDCYQTLSFPNTVNVEYKKNDKLSFEFLESMNSYKVGSRSSFGIVKQSRMFLYLGGNAKYHLNSLYNKLMWFDPYVSANLGYTLIGQTSLVHPGFGVGANFWVSEDLGINFQSMANFKVMSTSTNYLVNMVTIKYRY